MIAIAVTIVVVVVPIAVGVPTMLVFIPPAMGAVPAILARFVQFMPRMIRLFAFAAVMLDGFMKTMIGPGDAFLASVVIGAQTRCAGEEQKARQRGTRQHYFPDSKNSRLKFGVHPVLSSILKWGLKAGVEKFSRVQGKAIYQKFRK
jgi:hypothetical protein